VNRRRKEISPAKKRGLGNTKKGDTEGREEGGGDRHLGREGEEGQIHKNSPPRGARAQVLKEGGKSNADERNERPVSVPEHHRENR